jgi:hypothetical protein
MFDIANVSLGTLILILRIIMIFGLYFFLWRVLQVVASDLRGDSFPGDAVQATHGQLLLESPGKTGYPVGKIFLLEPITIIGRSMESDIPLNDDLLSSQHARISHHVMQSEQGHQVDEWQIEDLNSTNGTFVNGFEVRGETVIREGDVIRIGRIEMKLQKKSESPNAAAASASA